MDDSLKDKIKAAAKKHGPTALKAGIAAVAVHKGIKHYIKHRGAHWDSHKPWEEEDDDDDSEYVTYRRRKPQHHESVLETYIALKQGT